ncbi:MAG: trehalase family glycosidase [Bacteroidota bacterium]
MDISSLPLLRTSWLMGLVFLLACEAPVTRPPVEPEPDFYQTLNDGLVQGWNTWDNRNILAQVHLPEAFSLAWQVIDTTTGQRLKQAFTGNKVKDSEKVRTLAHSPDGSYTALRLTWREFDLLVQSVSEEGALHLLVTPDYSANNPGWVQTTPSFLYGRDGQTRWDGKVLQVQAGIQNWTFTGQGKLVPEEEGTFRLAGPVGMSSQALTIEGIQERIAAAETHYWAQRKSFKAEAQAYHIVQNAINWHVVYDPALNRAVTPVARTWSYGWGQREEGGFVQFCWDNFFVAYMHAIESKELAYNEVYQLTRIINEIGFVPNYAGPNGEYSRDRSQPPVGGMMVREIYRLHPQPQFLANTFDQLLTWNRWWAENRDVDGYLVWGSNPYPDIQHQRQETQNNHQAAAYESGLDNSPMFEEVPFDSVNHVMLQADAGLMGLYIADCEALAEMAEILNRVEEAEELRVRAETYRTSLQRLWNEETGLFLNKRLDTEEWNPSISPTNFYPLLGKAASPQQAKRMVQEHLMNPEEFWGEYVLPSISRNDPGYTAQDYWQGSIWAPMNFLVYLGLRKYDFPEEQRALADKSMALLVKNWEAKGLVLENYHAETGFYPGYRSEFFYHWGALLGMMSLIEGGHVATGQEGEAK